MCVTLDNAGLRHDTAPVHCYSIATRFHDSSNVTRIEADMKAKITKRMVESITPGERDVFVWDTDVRGFGCKVTPKGARVFILQYWMNATRRARRITLGRYGSELTADEARTEARRLRGAIAVGGDPALERAKAKEMPLLQAFAERYLAEHAKVKKKPLSYAADECNLRNHVLPVLGRVRVDALSRADVAKFHQGMKAKPGAANRCLALLSKMFNLAELWGLRPDGTNPTRHVEKYREQRIERYLSEAELARLGTVLRAGEGDGEHPSAVAALRLLIFTGCRRNEILGLEWEHVDFERTCLRLPDSKTGARLVPLGPPAIELLSGLPRIEGNPYVLSGRVPGGHYAGLNKAWSRMRKRAKLDDVRLHDLRHAFASIGAGLGESLVVIGGLLGHTEAATTQRYAHLSDDPLQAAAGRISRRIDAAMKGAPLEIAGIEAGRK